MFLKRTTSGGDVIHSQVDWDSGPTTHRAARDKRITTLPIHLHMYCGEQSHNHHKVFAHYIIGGIDSHSPRTLRTHIGLQLGSNGQYGELKRYDCGTPGTTPHTSSDKSAGVTSLHVKVHPDSLQTHNSWKCTRPQGKSHRSLRRPGRWGQARSES